MQGVESGGLEHRICWAVIGVGLCICQERVLIFSRSLFQRITMSQHGGRECRCYVGLAHESGLGHVSTWWEWRIEGFCELAHYGLSCTWN